VSIEDDDLEALADEVRRLIESNKQFLARVNDEEYEDEEDEEAGEGEPDSEDFEEL
jgi:hypothetical protein